jgi:Xaa-Pro aminopeptidase
MSYQKPFAKPEYAARVTRTKTRMREDGFDLILCQDPANMCYLNGFGTVCGNENGGERLCDVQRGLVVID